MPCIKESEMTAEQWETLTAKATALNKNISADENGCMGIVGEKEAFDAEAHLAPGEEMLLAGWEEGEGLRKEGKRLSAQAPEVVAAAGRTKEAAIRQAAARAQAASLQAAGAGGATGGGRAASARQGSLEAGARTGAAREETQKAVLEAQLGDVLFRQKAGTPAEDYMKAVSDHGGYIQSWQDTLSADRAEIDFGDLPHQTDRSEWNAAQKQRYEKMISGLIISEPNPYVRAWLRMMQESWGKTYAEAAAAAHADAGFLDSPHGKAIYEPGDEE